ncbi:uncharacterized protein TNCV_2451901 [Trichonephila clavipes]|nr:uncharacterized protein TNCV_2451901 [Trichonephila clavipes]
MQRGHDFSARLHQRLYDSRPFIVDPNNVNERQECQITTRLSALTPATISAAVGRCARIRCYVSFHPARSPDLTCLNYFLWGYVKSLVYESPVNSAEGLSARITATIGEVRSTSGVFANVRSSVHWRCEAYLTTRDHNFKHLLR